MSALFILLVIGDYPFSRGLLLLAVSIPRSGQDDYLAKRFVDFRSAEGC